MEIVSKSDLVARAADRTKVDHNVVNAILGSLLEEVQVAVETGKKVTIVGFGTFEGRHRAGRKGRNPSNGLPFESEATTAPAFKASIPFKKRVADAAKRAA